MAMRDLSPPWLLPHRHDPQAPTTTVSVSDIAINGANEKIAGIMEAPKTGNIRKVGFRTGTVTTGATVDVRLETVDTATGFPTGTLWGTNTNASQVILDTNDNTWFTVALTADAAVSKGDLIAVVVVNPAVSFGNFGLSRMNNPSNSRFGFPYCAEFDSGAWGTVDFQPIISLEYDDGSYDVAPDVWPIDNTHILVYNVNTVAQDEVALRFRLPFACRLSGFWLHVTPAGNFDTVLYTDGGSTIAALPFDTDVAESTTSSGDFQAYFREDGTNEIFLQKDTFYRLSVKPTTTSNVRVNGISVATAAIMNSFVGGTDFHFSSRVDAGAWTNDGTKRPLIGLIIDAYDAEDSVFAAGGASSTTTTSTSSTSTSTSTSSTSTSTLSTTTSSTSTTSTSTTSTTTSTSSTSTSSTTITETTTTLPPAPLVDSTDFDGELDLTLDFEPVRVITLNHAGNFRENPILDGVHFRIALHRHNADEVVKKCWISVAGTVLTDLTSRVVTDGEEASYVDVVAGVDLEATTPATLNIINWTTNYGHIEYGVWVAEQPSNMILLDGYNASDSTRPFIFRPEATDV